MVMLLLLSILVMVVLSRDWSQARESVAQGHIGHAQVHGHLVLELTRVLLLLLLLSVRVVEET